MRKVAPGGNLGRRVRDRMARPLVSESDLMWVPLYFARVWRANEIEGYRQLARCLGRDQPIYLIELPAESSRADYRATLESWSNHLVAAIRELSASGPLFLGNPPSRRTGVPVRIRCDARSSSRT